MIWLHLLFVLLSFCRMHFNDLSFTDLSNFMKLSHRFLLKIQLWIFPLKYKFQKTTMWCMKIFFQNCCKIQWRLLDDEYLSLTRLSTSNILHFTQNLINTILGAGSFKVRCTELTIAWMVQKEKEFKGSREKEFNFVRVMLCLLTQLWRIHESLFFWSKNRITSENRSVLYHIPGKVIKLILNWILSNKQVYLQETVNAYSSFFLPSV